MPYDRFMIAPFEEGQENRVRPFLQPDKSFEKLRNMYAWRKRLRKRVGATVMDTTQSAADQQLFTRLRINLGPTVAGALAGTVPGTVFKKGQMFSIGTAVYTVVTPGAVQDMLETVTTTTATYSTTNGAFNFVGAPAGNVYFYPSEPVMHYGTYEVAETNNEETFAFDTQFAYQYTVGSGWDRVSAGSAIWTTDANKDFYYWTTSYRGNNVDDFLLYTTNNVAADAMRYWDGATWNAWGSLATTPLGAGQFIKTCRAIMPFAGSLFLLNTTENNGVTDEIFRNRIRYSADSVNAAPTSNTAWLISTGAGLIDIPTKEAIIGAAYLKDVLIVECERSAFRVSATGNALEPFIVEQINAELGVESVNSIVQFDEVDIGFGSSGIHATDGQTVKEIDGLIPNAVFDVNNSSSGKRRVQGIRDFFTDQVYWSYPSVEEQSTYNVIWPNRVLVYDYVNKTWAVNDDSISAMGYFWRQQAQSNRQTKFRSVIGGNTEGFTFLMDQDVTRNSSSLSITNISKPGGNTVQLTIVDHNLPNNSYIYINNVITSNAAFQAQLNDKIFQITTTGISTLTFDLGVSPGAGDYEGGGTVELVSQPEILTKAFNFYLEESVQVAIQKVNFYVDKTTAGEFTVDFIPGASSVSLLADATSSGALIGNNILDTAAFDLVPMEAFQDRFWHAVNFSATGETVQLHIYLSNDQLTTQRTVSLTDYWIPFEDIQINAMAIFATKTQEFA